MVKIQDIATLSNGINFGKSAYVAGVKLIGVSDFKDRIYPDFGSLQEIDATVVRNADFLHKGDIVFVRSNGNKELVGRCMMINEDIPVTYSGFCIRLRLKDTSKYDPTYFTYLFKDNAFRKAMSGTAVGANIQNLSQGRLGSYEFNCPSIDTQHRIASILSRYDSLIANYQQQIKLLEEAAQRLYKEWFVDFRFPGHENTQIVDGVPEGWEKKRLEDLVFDSSKRITKKDRGLYECYMPIDCLPKKQLSYIDSKSVEQAESSLITFSRGDIIFGAMRPYFHKVCFARHSGITRTTCFVLRAKKIEYEAFASMLLFDEETVKYASSISVGTTMPYTRWSDFKKMEIVVPTIEIAVIFNTKVSNILTTCERFASQIVLLTEARDRLLPKLMNGEIEV